MRAWEFVETDLARSFWCFGPPRWRWAASLLSRVG